MEWTESLKKAIDYMESHLLDDIGTDEVASKVNISPFYFQKGFKIMTEYTVAEYIRNRRLYLAGLEVIAKREKIIDLAYKYGYDTPESFTKAFGRFHGVTPTGLQNAPYKIVPFLPLKIVVTVQGGNKMDYVVEKMLPMKLIGFSREVKYESGYHDIPKFWEEYANDYCMGKNIYPEKQERVEKCHIGELGVCIDYKGGSDSFAYLIAGRYDGGEVPEGMEIFEIPSLTWAKFRCVGPLPEALQTVNTKIFKEWLPGNPEYEMAEGINIEWYSFGDGDAIDYESAIWVPVKHK